ncbi:hypothetical protein L1987_07797 [Smallanthus sonchifolius]|uniref:Uncharacterized protein n=1 Tax=Smallanthus sonchifolius TaxID=185202 RepID=A0ACB9JIB8_9ASTR|nr:hypothetical protein L1987_07797 [Smallanthus sonchifolius]
MGLETPPPHVNPNRKRRLFLLLLANTTKKGGAIRSNLFEDSIHLFSGCVTAGAGSHERLWGGDNPQIQFVSVRVGGVYEKKVEADCSLFPRVVVMGDDDGEFGLGFLCGNGLSRETQWEGLLHSKTMAGIIGITVRVGLVKNERV